MKRKESLRREAVQPAVQPEYSGCYGGRRVAPAGAALERAAHILHANGKRFFHGLRALFDDPRLFGEDLIDAQGLVFDHGIEGRAVLIDLGDIRVERLTKAVACPGKLANNLRS